MPRNTGMCESGPLGDAILTPVISVTGDFTPSHYYIISNLLIDGYTLFPENRRITSICSIKSISNSVMTYLDLSVFSAYITVMPNIKISSKVDETAWEELKQLASESHQNISGVLTDAIRDYVRKRRIRPAVMQHLEDSIRDNEELGRLLAK